MKEARFDKKPLRESLQEIFGADFLGYEYDAKHLSVFLQDSATLDKTKEDKVKQLFGDFKVKEKKDVKLS